MSHPLDGETYDPAAIAAVIALRAIAPESVDLPADRVRVLPSQQVLTDGEAASSLAALPKPLHCTPSMDGDVLEISCGPVDPRIARLHRASLDPGEGGEWDAVDVMRRMRETGDGEVLVIGRGTEAVTLSLADFHRFEEEYSSGVSHFKIDDVPEFFGFPRGAATARRYSPSHGRTHIHIQWR